MINAQSKNFRQRRTTHRFQILQSHTGFFEEVVAPNSDERTIVFRYRVVCFYGWLENVSQLHVAIGTFLRPIIINDQMMKNRLDVGAETTFFRNRGMKVAPE
jgi:hypothetical protein